MQKLVSDHIGGNFFSLFPKGQVFLLQHNTPPPTHTHPGHKSAQNCEKCTCVRFWFQVVLLCSVFFWLEVRQNSDRISRTLIFQLNFNWNILSHKTVQRDGGVGPGIRQICRQEPINTRRLYSPLIQFTVMVTYFATLGKQSDLPWEQNEIVESLVWPVSV